MSASSCDSNAVKPSGTESAPRTQVSLKSLFLSTTYFSVASGVAVYWGAGWFIVAAGVFLTWISYRGYLWWLQTQRNRTRSFIVAWSLFVISLAVPAATIPGCGNSPPKATLGWELAFSGMNYGIDAIGDLEIIRKQSPQTTRFDPPLLAVLHAVFVNLPNIMMLFSPWLLYRQQRADCGQWSSVWGCAAVSTWVWVVTPEWKMLAGYYLWISAIHLLFLSRPIRVHTMLAMGVAGAVIFWMHFSS
jgi:hypothetical protein